MVIYRGRRQGLVLWLKVQSICNDRIQPAGLRCCRHVRLSLVRNVLLACMGSTALPVWSVFVHMHFNHAILICSYKTSFNDVIVNLLSYWYACCFGYEYYCWRYATECLLYADSVANVFAGPTEAKDRPSPFSQMEDIFSRVQLFQIACLPLMNVMNYLQPF